MIDNQQFNTKPIDCQLLIYYGNIALMTDKKAQPLLFAKSPMRWTAGSFNAKSRTD